MSNPQEPSPAKLVIGLFMREKNNLEEIALELSAKFGRIDLISAWMPFDYTTYYEQEMGRPLFRRVFAFEEFIQQSALATIKIATNAIEQIYSHTGRRSVNIDPGYLLQERFVLASGKNFSHRIYIGRGIYADLTLVYSKGGFQKLPWTYPDYADKPMLGFLGQVRGKYVLQLKRGIA
jgi:hypothetical protein